MVRIPEMEHVDASNQYYGFLHSNEAAQRKRIEYWSKTYDMWIPAEITAVDHDRCAVQVNVKPGVWLKSMDWDKKLRVAVYSCSEKVECDDLQREVRNDIDNCIGDQNLNKINVTALDTTKEYYRADMVDGGRDTLQIGTQLDLSAQLGTQMPPDDRILSSIEPTINSDSPLDESDSRCQPLEINTSSTAFCNHLENDCIFQDATTNLEPLEAQNEVLPADRLQASLVFESSEWISTDDHTEAIPTVSFPNAIGGNIEHSGFISEGIIPPVTYATAIGGGIENSGFISEGRFAGYLCPNCGAGGLETIQAAIDHCASAACSIGRSIDPLGVDNVHSETVAVDGAAESTEVQSGSLHDMIEASTRAAEGREGPLTSEFDQADLAEEECKASVRETCEPAIEANAAFSNIDLCSPEFVKPRTRILGYCCPKCGEGKLATLEEAVKHCQDPDDPVVLVSEGLPTTEERHVFNDASPTCTDAPRVIAPDDINDSAKPLIVSLPQPPPIRLLPGQPVAYNEFGHPIISRQVDPETGYGSTLVLNENGTCDVFGKQTITSLLSSTQDEAHDWFQALSDYQLRGLVHELGQRLLDASSTYQARLKQYEGVSEKENLAFFGLGSDATDRDLDVAYRQMSKRMHPDKNGGTEESKERFQAMKKRYEELKKKRGMADDTEKKEKGGEKDEDDDSKTIEFDPTKRECLNETAAKMLSQLSTLDTSLGNLMNELRRHGFAV